MTYNTGTQTLTRWQPWSYRDATWVSKDISGYGVMAIDGKIGKIDKAVHQMDTTSSGGTAYLIVDTGLLGDKVMLPAGVVSGVDHNAREVIVERTKEQIKNAPLFDQKMIDDPAYRQSLSAYYGEGAGWHEPTR
jgi:hypothetical protein